MIGVGLMYVATRCANVAYIIANRGVITVLEISSCCFVGATLSAFISHTVASVTRLVMLLYVYIVFAIIDSVFFAVFIMFVVFCVLCSLDL